MNNQEEKKPWIGAAALLAYLLIIIIILVNALHMAGAEAEAMKPHFPDRGYKWALVNTSQVNFREGPGREYRVVKQWSWGVAVEVLEQCGGWTKVLHWSANEPVWVWSEYLTPVE